MRAAIVALSLGLCIIAAGCGKKSDSDKTVTVSGQSGNVMITGNGQHMTMKSDDGKTTVEFNAGGMVHANMPDFAPLYPGAKVVSSISGANSGTGGNGAMVSFTVAAAPADVIAFYKQKAAGAGLGETMNATQGDAMTFVASKDKKSLEVIATKSDAGTTAQIIWGSGQ